MLHSKPFNDLFEPVQAELELTLSLLNRDLQSNDELINSVITYIFSSGGKHIRPALSLLSSKLFLNELSNANYKIAGIAEIIHTATLLHDDVIDNAYLRRNKKTVSAIWGNKVSVICGDYLLAKASMLLASLNNTYIVNLFARVLEEICLGEIQQSAMAYDTKIQWDDYLLKSTRKTATLFASAMEGGAIVSNANEKDINSVKKFGHYYGLAFQIVDDVLNFYPENQVGKPRYEDLRSGIITAPVLYAMEEYPELVKLIESKFEDNNNLELAVEIIKGSSGINKSKVLARDYVNQAICSLKDFKDTHVKESLEFLAEFVIKRDF